jgi:hypothetical protein
MAIATAHVCSAQSSVAGRYEVSAGGKWFGPIGVATKSASETTPGGGTSPLFASTTTLDSSFSAAAGFGVRLTRAIHAEMAATYGSGQLSSRVTGDAEQVASVTVRSPVTQLSVEGGMLLQPSRWQTRRLQPFAAAGVGYVRQMYAGRTLIEPGHELYIGGGLYYVRVSAHPRRLEATGLRVDVRGYLMRGGIAAETTQRSAPAVTAMVFVRF